MAFAVDADSYDLFMGRYSVPLAPSFAAFARVVPGQRVLDVGCGPGALTAELAALLGAGAVTAVDPSESFATAAEERHPGVAVHCAAAEQLPFPDATFDAALAQLVIHLVADSEASLGEMVRVTREGGVVAACVWDYAGGQAPLSVFWEAAHDLDADVVDESGLPGAREGHLTELFEAAGLHDVEEAALSVRVEHPTFEEWWEPYMLGVGPAGDYLAGLGPEHQAELRERCRARLPEAPFVPPARVWAARGLV